MIALLAGLFGLLIGSFLNVCIYRWPRDLSVVRPRSHCPACERTIAWYDNLPLVSFLLLRARCRHCRAAIAYRYPAVELLTGASFCGIVAALGPTSLSAKYCCFSAIVIALIFTDLEERILPDEFTLGGTLIGVAFAGLVPMEPSIWRVILAPASEPWLVSICESAFAGGFSALVLWSVGAVYRRIRHREGLGLGDIKMIAMIGAFLGLQSVLLTLIAGSTLGAVVGLGYILFTRQDAATYELPFGTFLGIAALGVAWYGQLALTWWRALGA